MNIPTWKNRVRALTLKNTKNNMEYKLLSNNYESVRNMVRNNSEKENVDKLFHNVFEKYRNIRIKKTKTRRLKGRK